MNRDGEGVVEFATKEDMFRAKKQLDGTTFKNPFDAREVGGWVGLGWVGLGWVEGEEAVGMRYCEPGFGGWLNE